MPAPEPSKGKTLWEMFLEWLRGPRGKGEDAAGNFYNPLDLRVGSPVRMAHANGPEYAGYDFSVQEIRQYTRHIGGKQFVFTDYVLRGVNKQTFDAEQAMTARLRVVPNAAGAHDALLLKLYDEFAFAEDFLAVLKDETGIFEVTDDAGAKETFTRINQLRSSYEAEVLVISNTNPEGKAEDTAALKVEYWDYWRDVNGRKEFFFAELNSTTGWFQLWRGKEYF